jgi:hypothetical protein
VLLIPSVDFDPRLPSVVTLWYSFVVIASRLQQESPTVDECSAIVFPLFVRVIDLFLRFLYVLNSCSVHIR